MSCTRLLHVATMAFVFVAAAPSLGNDGRLDELRAKEVPVVLRVCHVGRPDACDGECDTKMHVISELKNESGLRIEPHTSLWWPNRVAPFGERSELLQPPPGEVTVYVKPRVAHGGGIDWSLAGFREPSRVGYSHAECPWNWDQPPQPECWNRCLERLGLPIPEDDSDEEEPDRRTASP